MLRGKLDSLCTELADLAFALERRRRLDAADVAMSLHARIAEIRDELVPPGQEALAPESREDRLIATREPALASDSR